ncbi:HAMP domain-containing histidine kinase [Sphingobacterium alkalisoli]|uniref:histidine kinase n=1 Tax=Sphingobacterium alkalisoli TaxID=1874115 RepID=A0A4U0HA43_9SPHI|nr:HAMP domain-containing sensor histidine kinase [Sphingobacterium alkalisoli]TJY68741.1 HAMP domain-containing histidine kinase [Sphingobacterium alkalisoli]GGH04416.1 two-component sensor histidine kinase [Sphingobacterium alkalisoli]
MRITENRYKILSFAALFFLIILQLKFLISTYEITNAQYFLEERELLNRRYREGIVNDYVYPGGKRIIDSVILHEIDTLAILYDNDIKRFQSYGDSLYRKVIHDLRNGLRADTFFTSLLRENLNDNDFLHCVMLLELSVTNDGVNYIALDGQTEYAGVPMGGSLRSFNKNNEITRISVSSPIENTYRISFAWHVDYESRSTRVMLQMLPVFLLSLISLAMVVVIYIMIYQNWHKQKRLSMMTTDFLNSVTHEFNTPLASIIVANQSLKNLNASDDKLQLIHAVIQRQSVRLQRLINQTISVTKLEEESVDQGLYDIQDLLHQILHDYNLNKRNEVVIEFDDQVGSSANPVLLNEFLFTTLIFNLLDNAVKFNTSSKKIIHVKLIQQNNELQVSIRDNGIGISEKAKNKVFDQFYRESEKIKTAGLGLGLFYVKKIVDFHRWNIKLNSVVGKGSEFIIVLSRT